MTTSALRSIQLICLLAILRTADLTTYSTWIMIGGDIPTGYTYYSAIKGAHKVSETKLSWFDAREACANEDARLAVLDTAEKVGYLTGQLRLGENWAWTGITRNSSTSPWVDVNGGEIPQSLPWGTPGYTPLGGDCVAVSDINGRLGNFTCSEEKMYICEIPGERSLH